MAGKKSTEPATSPARASELLPAGYEQFLGELKDRIRRAQLRASVAVNREFIELYWQIGKGLVETLKVDGWGNSVIDRLGEDLQEAFMGDFSRTNVYRTRAFFLAYRDSIVPQAVGQSPEGPPAATTEIPWGHNVVLVGRVNAPAERLWYAKASVEHGWSRSILALQIEGRLFARQGRVATLVPDRFPERAVLVPILERRVGAGIDDDPLVRDGKGLPRRVGLGAGSGRRVNRGPIREQPASLAGNAGPQLAPRRPGVILGDDRPDARVRGDLLWRKPVRDRIEAPSRAPRPAYRSRCTCHRACAARPVGRGRDTRRREIRADRG
jgi:predicted nuclease of restriction endonuclease-like (RecB) superfamily